MLGLELGVECILCETLGFMSHAKTKLLPSPVRSLVAYRL